MNAMHHSLREQLGSTIGLIVLAKCRVAYRDSKKEGRCFKIWHPDQKVRQHPRAHAHIRSRSLPSRAALYYLLTEYRHANENR